MTAMLLHALTCLVTILEYEAMPEQMADHFVGSVDPARLQHNWSQTLRGQTCQEAQTKYKTKGLVLLQQCHI